MNWNKHEKHLSWPNFKFYSYIEIEGQCKTTEIGHVICLRASISSQDFLNLKQIATQSTGTSYDFSGICSGAMNNPWPSWMGCFLWHLPISIDSTCRVCRWKSERMTLRVLFKAKASGGSKPTSCGMLAFKILINGRWGSLEYHWRQAPFPEQWNRKIRFWGQAYGESDSLKGIRLAWEPADNSIEALKPYHTLQQAPSKFITERPSSGLLEMVNLRLSQR
jgi:hypothetical protein